jgi:CubicO group peptidase (beta-lactamase class C family)
MGAAGSHSSFQEGVLSRKEHLMVRPESVGMSSERLARIGPAVEKYVGETTIAGAVTLVARHGQIVHHECTGLMDRGAQESGAKAMRPDALFRIYSMTKPITCTALMTLYERGAFQLTDPVAKYIPAFGKLKAYAGGEGADLKLVDLARPVTVRDLLTHTSGLTYHFFEYGPVEALYREARVSSLKPLDEFVADLLEMPLAFQPGTRFRYGCSHDVAAHLIQVLSDQPLDAYLREKLFEPLGMLDTGYWVPPEKQDRLCAMYGTVELGHPDTTATQWYTDAEIAGNHLIAGPADDIPSNPHNVLRGGHGLVASAIDYYRFCQMLVNGGELGGTRVLGRKTIELMTANHLLPDLLPYEVGGFYSPGYGYGLGVRVMQDVGQAQMPGSVGEFGWGGAATTEFWIDPREQLVGVLMAQFQPSGFHPIASDFRVATYQAIVD